MNLRQEICRDGSRLTISLPLAIRKRGGRKIVIAPDGSIPAPSSSRRPDSKLVKAIARAHRWQQMLEEGAYASMRDLARAERISATYVARLLRLTLLAPDIVETILDGRQPDQTAQDLLMKPVPDCWFEQRWLVNWRA